MLTSIAFNLNNVHQRVTVILLLDLNHDSSQFPKFITMQQPASTPLRQNKNQYLILIRHAHYSKILSDIFSETHCKLKFVLMYSSEMRVDMT